MKGVPMPICTKLTPNLLVADVERSLAFYTGVLGFALALTVREQPPYVFASVTSGPVEVYFNLAGEAVKELPMLKNHPIGLSGTMFIEVEDIKALHEQLRATVPIVMPFVTQWYGMMEFAIADPDGYVITFAQRA